MPRKPTAWRRLTTATRWPVGIMVTSWRYMWRTTPIKRDEVAGSRDADWPPPLPDGVDRDEVQPPERGAGPLFHRRYRIRIADGSLGPRELIDDVTADLDRVVPRDMASFEKVLGQPGRMAVGDEYVVRMPGPWDGPVRVTRRKGKSVRLVTLATHLEAGQIEFRARREGELVVFEIESWARSSGRLVNLLYHRLRMAKEIQLHLWTSLLERAVKRAGGRRSGPIEIHTRRVDLPA